MNLSLTFLVFSWTIIAAAGRKANTDRNHSSKETTHNAVVPTTEGSTCHTILQVYNHSRYTVYKVNETIELACALSTTDAPNITLFYLVHYGTGQRLEPSRSSDGNQAVFEIASATVDDAGQYDCYYGDCRTPNPTLTSFVQIHVVDLSPPLLECMSTNVRDWTSYNITCSWTRRRDNYSSCWLLQIASRNWRISTVEAYQNCSGIVNTDLCPNFYPSQSCSVVVDNFFTSYEYEIHLSESLYIDGETLTSNYNYTIPADNSIVKLNPVADLYVSAEKPREMTLTWQIDGSGSTLSEDILCNISYWSQWNPSVTQFTGFAIPTPIVMYTTTLENLEPFTYYTFGINIKSPASPYWSGTSEIEGRTLPEVPVDVPSNIAYTQVLTEDENLRKLFLYWQPLKPRQWYGSSTAYVLNVTCRSSNHFAATEVFPANSTFYTVSLDQVLPSASPCELTIQSKNSVGLSEKMAMIHIPVLGKDIEPDMVQAEEQEPDVYNVVVMDTRSRSGDVRYIMYWCQGYLDKDIPICVENFHSQQGSESNFTIIVNQSNERYPWFFGAAIQEMNQTSRIFWANNKQELSAPSAVAMEEDNSLKVAVGVIGVIVLVILGMCTRFIVYPRIKKHFKTHEIEDIVDFHLKNGGVDEVSSSSGETSSLLDDFQLDILAKITDYSDYMDGARVGDIDLFSATHGTDMENSEIPNGDTSVESRNDHSERERGYDSLYTEHNCTINEEITVNLTNQSLVQSTHYVSSAMIKDQAVLVKCNAVENGKYNQPLTMNIHAEFSKDQSDCFGDDIENNSYLEIISGLEEKEVNMNSLPNQNHNFSGSRSSDLNTNNIPGGSLGNISVSKQVENVDIAINTQYVQQADISDMNNKNVISNGYVSYNELNRSTTPVDLFASFKSNETEIVDSVVAREIDNQVIENVHRDTISKDSSAAHVTDIVNNEISNGGSSEKDYGSLGNISESEQVENGDRAFNTPYVQHADISDMSNKHVISNGYVSYDELNKSNTPIDSYVFASFINNETINVHSVVAGEIVNQVIENVNRDSMSKDSSAAHVTDMENSEISNGGSSAKDDGSLDNISGSEQVENGDRAINTPYVQHADITDMSNKHVIRNGYVSYDELNKSSRPVESYVFASFINNETENVHSVAAGEIDNQVIENVQRDALSKDSRKEGVTASSHHQETEGSA